MTRRRCTAAACLGALVPGCAPETSADGNPGERAAALGAWEVMAAVPEPRTEVSVASIGDRIYMLGGFGPPTVPGERASAPRTLWVYHTAEDRWEAAGEILAGTNHAGLVALDGRLYIVGGYVEAGFEPTGRVHVYEPATGAWSTGVPMPTPRGALAYAALDGRIHTFGGTVAGTGANDRLDAEEHPTHSSDASVGTHEVYDPVAEVWERLPPMPTPRNHHAAEAVDGVIVVTAGRAGNDMTMTATEVWDPAAGTWREGAPLPTGRSGVAAAALDGWLYLFGGESQRTYDEAERYRVAEDRWEAIEPMPSTRHGLGAAVVDGAIYVISGGPRPGFTYGTANERYVP